MKGANLFFKIDYERDLNEEQLSVVMHPGGPMLVIAGAGSGKTRTITYRVARLVELGVSTKSILLLTFTNRAAREMLQRAEELTGCRLQGLWGGTFHHLGHLLLRRHSLLMGYNEGFTIIDREDQKQLLESSATEVFGDEEHPKGAVLTQMYSLLNNARLTLEDLIEGPYYSFHSISEALDRTFRLYRKKKLSLNLMDFDDLIHYSIRLLKEFPELRTYYASRFKHILVDEYQDTNELQSEMIDLLASVHRNLMVVGDDAQSIYSFRGASVDKILNFPERYPDLIIFKLRTNYRSTPEILGFANEIIARNKNQFFKELVSLGPPGEKPYVIKCSDPISQAGTVAALVESILNEGVNPEEIAILYRAHYLSMETQMELQKRDIPYEVRSGLRFFEQAHIKDILSYLRILNNPFDEVSWKRILKMISGIGNVTAEKLWKELSRLDDPLNEIDRSIAVVPKRAKEHYRVFLSFLQGLLNIDYKNHPQEAIHYILQNGYEDYLRNTFPNAESRYEDIMQLARYTEEYIPYSELPHNRLELLLGELSLQNLEPHEGGHRPSVILSSVHQAKGLEWENVIVIGLNEGLFPSRKASDERDLEEERRLFYVAVTRAKRNLYLFYTEMDSNYRELKKSRFLKELSPERYQEVKVQSSY